MIVDVFSTSYEVDIGGNEAKSVISGTPNKPFKQKVVSMEEQTLPKCQDSKGAEKKSYCPVNIIFMIVRGVIGEVTRYKSSSKATSAHVMYT